MEIKIQCECGARYKFDIEPVHGRMPMPVKCPECGADGTVQANQQIRQTLGIPEPTPAPAPPPPPLRPIAASAPPPPPPPPPPAGGLRINKAAAPPPDVPIPSGGYIAD